jgi:hypothetical protein
MRVRDTLNDEGLAAFTAGMSEAGATPEQIEAALDADQPDGGPLAATQSFAGHAKVSGAHTHTHPTYASSGARTHEHIHRHAGDAAHSHHAAASATTAAAHLSMMAEPAAPTEVLVLADGRRVDVPEPALSRGVQDAIVASAADGASLVAAAMEVLDSPFGVEQRDGGWTLLGRDGELGTFERYELAVERLGGLAFADAARPVLEQTWRSEMCFEDEETPDGRYLAPGSLRYREPPLPFMLQTLTEVGHFGAVLAGAVLACKTSDGVALGSGEFDDNDAGREALRIVEARGRFGVSIDGMQPADAEYECTDRNEDGECTAERIRFNLLTIGGLTGTPFPAFPNAYIALEQRAAQAASAAPEEPCADCGPEGEQADARARADSTPIPVGKEEAIPAGREHPMPFTASGGVNLAEPPAEWFANPNFRPGDGRLVRQPSGRWAAPLTVTADGEVFGHMASWFSCHTGYADRCVRPPRSKSGYQAFMLRPVQTADGTLVKVGHLSMGCGHASTAASLTPDEVRAHYDGGPGAVRMAQVACGEDAYGIWFHGAVSPEATAEQVRAFAACSVSGDWREVWRGGGLELVACLAGVTVPGFPIAAAAFADVDMAPEVLAPGYREIDGRPVALVAAGMVGQPSPEQRQIGELHGRVDEMERRFEERLQAAEAVTQELRGEAAERIMASLNLPVAASNGRCG